MDIGETTNNEFSEFSTVKVELEAGDRPEKFLDWFDEWSHRPDTRSKFRIDLYFGVNSTSAVITDHGQLRAFLDGWKFRDSFDRR